MATGSGNLLWGREIKRLDNRAKQHIDRCWFRNSGRHAIPQNFDECHVRACRVGQHLWLRLNPVQFIEEDQSSKMLNGVLVSSCTWPHCVPRGRPKWDKNIGHHKRELVLMKCSDCSFDGSDDRNVCPQGFRDGALHDFYMLRVVIDE